MPAELVSFSSAQLRERDEKLKEKFEKEKAELERKIQKTKAVADAYAKDLFDFLNRSKRLAKSLGYEDIYEAQVAVDSSEYNFTFKEAMDRMRLLEVEVETERKEAQLLQVKLDNALANSGSNEELDSVKKELRQTKAQHRDLQERYDALNATKNRAAQQYKTDYKKWRAFYEWLFSEDDRHKKDRSVPGLSREEKKKQDVASVMRKREKLIEIGPDMARLGSALEEPGDDLPPPTGPTTMAADKENDGTPTPSQKKRPLSAITRLSPPRPLRETLLRPVTNLSIPTSSSPDVFMDKPTSTVSARTPLVFRSIDDAVEVKREPSPTSSPVLSGLSSSKRSLPHIGGSSDTEDDSQAVFVPSTNPRAGRTTLFKVPVPPSTVRKNILTPFTSSLPAKPSTSQDSVDARRKLNSPLTTPLRELELEEPPSKVRRLSGEEFGRRPATTSRLTLGSLNGKGKERDSEPTPSTLRTTQGQKRLDDYSTFKGRGRYAVSNQTDETTINAQYAINSDTNNGKSYQYDEVVRNREDRRKMNADDCECCSEYYRNVGPLPPRLQAPLWRSPTSTPVKPCSRHSHSHSHSPESHSNSNNSTSHSHSRSEPRAALGLGRPGSSRPRVSSGTTSTSVTRDKGYPSKDAAADKDAQMEAHKKAISRHRHNWARPKTPPGYWDIGFPSTQEVGDINERAREMHRQKKEEVEREARTGGRYRRRE